MLSPAQKLAASGITPSLAKRLKIRTLTAAQTAKQSPHFREAPSILLPYPPEYVFFRVRYLDTDELVGQRRYDQPAGSVPRAYLSPQWDWKRVAENVHQEVWITEGEFKAICAGVHELPPTIGLGGVWSWKSQALGNSFLPELAAIQWKGRPVTLCFDADIVVKDPVQQALLALAGELARRGARCRRVLLPGPEKGLDDFLEAHGRKALERLPGDTVQQDELEKRTLFDRFVYVSAHDQVYDLERDAKYRGRPHFENACGNLFVAGPKGPTPLPAPWYRDPQRVTVTSYQLRPRTLDRIVEDPSGERVLNTFRGFAKVPRRGTVEPMLRILDSVVGSRPEIRKWVLQWMAYPLQRPGTKLQTSIFVYHKEQGIGKSALGYLLLDIYGKDRHGVELTDDDFFSKWNPHLEWSLFALCDDLSFEGSKKSRNAFVNAITQETVQLSAKYRNSITIENHCNYYFTANSAGALPLDVGNSNRRVLVLEVQKPITDRAWFTTTFHDWRHDEGPSHWLDYLLRVDLAGFAPYGDAPETKEKRDAMAASAPSLSAWVLDALARGVFSQHEVWTSQQLLRTARSENHDLRLSAQALARALHAAGAEPLGQHLVLKGHFESFWALRNPAVWKKKSGSQIVAAWKQAFPTEILL